MIKAAFALILLGGCTVNHSRQALWNPQEEPPSPTSTFISEEDSGLSLIGLLNLSEPDHYAVLLERARRRHHCGRLIHPQLDFYTDHWVVVSFSIARITALCEPSAPQIQKTSDTPSAPKADPVKAPGVAWVQPRR